MQDALLTDVSIAFIGFILLSLISGKRVLSCFPWILLFTLIQLIDNLLVTCGVYVPAIRLIDSRLTYEGIFYCNWDGKLYSILAMLLIIYCLRKRFTRDDFALTFKQNAGSWHAGLILLAAILILVSVFGFLTRARPFNTEALLYCLVMPAMNEELVYRGLLLGIADKIFCRKWLFFNVKIGWGLILTSVIFGLCHGFSIGADGTIHIIGSALILTSVMGFMFGWIRERSGSLVWPVVLHALTDFGNIIPMLK